MRHSHGDQFGTLLPSLLIGLMIIAAMFSVSHHVWQNGLMHHRVTACAYQLTHFLQRSREYAYFYNQNIPITVIVTGTAWCVIAGTTDNAGCHNRLTRFASWHCPYPQVQFFMLRGKPGFYGADNNARTGSIEFGQGTEHLRVVISSRGRIRLCWQHASSC